MERQTRQKPDKHGKKGAKPANEGVRVWHEVPVPRRKPWRRRMIKVDRYGLEVNAMAKPMMVREDEAPCGGKQA